MTIKIIVSVATLFFLFSCAVIGVYTAEMATNIVDVSASATHSLSVNPTETFESELVITAEVKSVSLSAQVIFLERPVSGFCSIALTDESILATENQEKIYLRDIQPDSKIQVVGLPGGSNTLLARKVIVLDK
jgi:hypothetical protein